MNNRHLLLTNIRFGFQIYFLFHFRNQIETVCVRACVIVNKDIIIHFSHYHSTLRITTPKSTKSHYVFHDKAE